VGLDAMPTTKTSFILLFLNSGSCQASVMLVVEQADR